MQNRTLRIIHHNDFDGIISAGIFSKFSQWQHSNDITLKYQSIDYNELSDFLKTTYSEPLAILDFPYHPQALWWFDHHSTSFAKEAFRKKYSPNKHQYWSTRYKSCPALLFAFFGRHYPDFYASNVKYFKEIVRYSNIIDSAMYENPKQAYDLKNPYIFLNTLLMHTHDRKFHEKIINSLVDESFHDFINSEKMRKMAQHAKQSFDKQANLLKQRIKIKDKTAFFNLLGYRKTNHFSERYIPYYFYPNLKYVVIADKRYDKYYLGLSHNPWKTHNRINLGLLLSKYAGGGRKNVAAVLLNTKEDLDTVAQEILKVLLLKT